MGTCFLMVSQYFCYGYGLLLVLLAKNLQCQSSRLFIPGFCNKIVQSVKPQYWLRISRLARDGLELL